MIDKDYLEYKRGVGKWTAEQELTWEYLSSIVDLLTKISGQLEAHKGDLTTGLPPLNNTPLD